MSISKKIAKKCFQRTSAEEEEIGIGWVSKYLRNSKGVLSAIIRVFLYFVIFEEKVNAVVYILATFKFWQNLQKKMINLAWSHLKWMQMYLQRMIYKRAPLFQGAAAPTQREREPFCQSLLWHDWFVQAWLLLSVILQKNGNKYSWLNWQLQKTGLVKIFSQKSMCDSYTTYIPEK